MIQDAISLLLKHYDDVRHFLNVATRYYETVNFPNEEIYTLCLLHDILEDKKVTPKEIDIIFSSEMADNCVRLDHHEFDNYEEYVKYCLKVNPKVAIVKLCDFIENYLTLARLCEPKRTKLIKKYNSVVDHYIEFLLTYGNMFTNRSTLFANIIRTAQITYTDLIS